MNYKKVIADFNSGKIAPKKFQLIMDNDCGFWSCIDYSLDDETRDELADEMNEKYGTPDGYHDIVDILIAAGVNADWC